MPRMKQKVMRTIESLAETLTHQCGYENVSNIHNDGL